MTKRQLCFENIGFFRNVFRIEIVPVKVRQPAKIVWIVTGQAIKRSLFIISSSTCCNRRNFESDSLDCYRQFRRYVDASWPFIDPYLQRVVLVTRMKSHLAIWRSVTESA